MRRVPIILVAALLAAPAAAQPAAGAGDANGDVRCLMTMLALAGQKGQEQAGQMGAYYYAGRLAALSPSLDFRSAMTAQAPTLTRSALPSELKRCSGAVNAAQQAMQMGLDAVRAQADKAPPDKK